MKRILLLMLLVISLAGCTGGIPTNTAPTNVQPQGKIIQGNEEYPMIINKYVWKDGKSESRKLSGPDIYELANSFDTLAVEKEESLKIEIEQNPTLITVKEIDEKHTVKEIQIEDNEIPLPAEDGYYIYEVSATWAKGEISYVFDMQIN